MLRSLGEAKASRSTHFGAELHAPGLDEDEQGTAPMPLTSAIKGVVPIAPTPFHPDGRVDEDSLARMTDWLGGCGVDGVTILGQLGEAPKLEHAEARAIVASVAKRFDKPIVVGVSAPGFAAMRALARESMELGAAGVMIAPPNTLRTDDQIVAYYAQASEAIGRDVPFIIQDYPLTFSVVMTPAVIRRIVNDNEACVTLKHEDWPGLEKITALRGFERDGSMRHIAILVGNGGLFLDFETERGADGANTGYAFPEMLVDVVRLTAEGRRDEAHDLFDAHLPYLRYEQQQGSLGLAARKYVLMRRGVLASDAQRRPAAGLSAQAKEEIEYLLSRVARADARARLQPL
jgi:4-hydroxy-tetrahydrodipicolinate synthase